MVSSQDLAIIEQKPSKHVMIGLQFQDVLQIVLNHRDDYTSQHRWNDSPLVLDSVDGAEVAACRYSLESSHRPLP